MKLIEKDRFYVGQEQANWAGVFGTKYHFGTILFNLVAWDMEYVKDVKLKYGERLYRFASDNMILAGDSQRPLVKINIFKDLIYFLKPDTEDIDFETRGEKATFLILKEI